MTCQSLSPEDESLHFKVSDARAWAPLLSSERLKLEMDTEQVVGSDLLRSPCLGYIHVVGATSLEPEFEGCVGGRGSAELSE